MTTIIVHDTSGVEGELWAVVQEPDGTHIRPVVEGVIVPTPIDYIDSPDEADSQE